MGITFKRDWGEPIVELLKLLEEQQRRHKSYRRHCHFCHQNRPGPDVATEINYAVEKELRDVIRQIHIIRNAKRGRREDGRWPFKPTADEEKLISAQFFAMAAMSDSGAGQIGNGNFVMVMMDKDYLEKTAEITKEQYERLGGDGSAMEKWGPFGFPHD